MEILYGTTNKAKVKSMEKIIKEHNFDITIKTLPEIGFNEEIVEDGTTFEENSEIKAKAIQEFCKKNNINVTLRKEFGTNVDAACGQLRAKIKEE